MDFWNLVGIGLGIYARVFLGVVGLALCSNCFSKKLKNKKKEKIGSLAIAILYLAAYISVF